MDPSGPGFEALPLPNILPGPTEDEMQNTTGLGLGLVFPLLLVLCWPQPAQSFGGKSYFSYYDSGENF